MYFYLQFERRSSVQKAINSYYGYGFLSGSIGPDSWPIGDALISHIINQLNENNWCFVQRFHWFDSYTVPVRSA